MGTVLTLVIGAAIGAVASVFLTAFFQRPKLRMSGSGGGSDGESVMIQNQPGLFGFRVQESAILGKRINGYKEIGFPMARHAAIGCHAWLWDVETDRGVALLHWREPAGPVMLNQHVTISDSEQRTLMVFAQEPHDYVHFDQHSAYYPWQYNTDDPNRPLVPHQIAFTEPRNFEVRVKYANGNKQIRIIAEVKREFNGRLTFQFRPK